MKNLTIPCLLLTLAACSAPEPEALAQGSTPMRFDGSASTEGLTQAGGQWNVVRDASAPSGDQVLAQEALRASPEFNLVLVESSHQQEVDVSVSLRSIAGEIDQGGGLVWRAQDSKNYYVARYNPLEDNYRVYTVVDGVRTQLQSATIPHSGGWHRLRVTMNGTLIRCYYDGQLQLELDDGTFGSGGRIGLWTKADAQTHFDDLQ